jgi:hypothetical protein
VGGQVDGLTHLLVPRLASSGHAQFGAPGDPSGRRHSPIMASPARTLGTRPCEDPAGLPGRQGGEMGLVWPGLTGAATRLCVCEDPRLRRRRRALPLGELRVPLRKLAPNRARSFNICLEKRRPVSGVGAHGGAAEPGTERGGDKQGPGSVSQGDQVLCPFRPRGQRA